MTVCSERPLRREATTPRSALAPHGVDRFAQRREIELLVYRGAVDLCCALMSGVD